MKKRKTYYADFETTQPDENNSVEVYLWVILANNDVFKGFTIESFIEKVKSMRAVIYFHNLKFDFSYIQYYCLLHDIQLDICEKKGQIYQVKIFDSYLRDSMNFLPMTLKEVGENYCSNYFKTSIDYNVSKGHKATDEEIKYCIQDCRVLEEGLTNYLLSMEEVLAHAGCEYSKSRVQRKLTNAGIAFEAFKELSEYEHCCPKTTIQEYEMFRPAYKGGYVFSNPRGIVSDVQMIDCNSMYPFIYSTIEMPFGKPIGCDSLEDCKKYKFFIVNVWIKYDLKNGYIPIVGGGVGKYGGITYKETSGGEFEELTLCNIDLELIQRFYDTEIIFNWGRGFNTKPEFFKKFSDVFIKIKNANKGIKRAVAKVILNSPYGKTAMNGKNEIKRYFIDEKDHSVKSEVIGYSMDEEVFQYLPIAIQITAGARKLLLETAEKIGFEDIHYMDTDSIKFTQKETNIKYDPDTLGAWKDEGFCYLFKTIAPKKYVYYYFDDKKQKNLIKYTCAGFSKKVLTEEMEHGMEVSFQEAKELMKRFDKGLALNCLQSKKVEGGRALIPVLKEMK